MINYYPITLYLTPGEYAALYDFLQPVANRLLNCPRNQLTNDDLILADYWQRQFTYTRLLAWSKKPTAKAYKLTLGLLYARLLHTHMQQVTLTARQQNVLAKLDQALI